MNHQRLQLAQRRNDLINEASKQRVKLAASIEPLVAPLSVIDSGIRATSYIVKRPFLLAGIVLTASLLMPKRWFLFLEGGWMLWHLSHPSSKNLEE
jgi:hypothetical protein